VDEDLVRAQETRRILDRLVGYTVSPLLWKKIAGGLSAGRVQSVAVRLLVQRERERRAFRSGTLLGPQGQARQGGRAFTAQLHSVGGKRVATGKDFDENTGRIAEGRDVLLLDEAEARRAARAARGGGWRVAETEEKPTVRRPAPPFTTSTLQQEANRKLRLSARDTMRIAQRLYEEGYITYMRTDSVHLSQQAISAPREPHPEAVRRGVPEPAAAAVHDQEQGRAGGARGDPPGGHRDAHGGGVGLTGREARCTS
jgi:DNA topoisomerase I